MFKQALGWDVLQAMNGYDPIIPEGRMIVVGGGYWGSDSTGGFPGYDGNAGGGTTFQADSDTVLDAMVRWAAQVPTGPADILIVQQTGDPGMFGTQFQAGLTRLGHTFTLTESGTEFVPFEPLDYDLLICPQLVGGGSYHGLTVPADKIDYVLSNQGHILTEQWTVSALDRYGIQAAGFHSSHTPVQRPFQCAEIGPVNPYKLVMSTTTVLLSTTNTMGGTRNIYYCDTHGSEGVIGLWDES